MSPTLPTMLRLPSRCPATALALLFCSCSSAETSGVPTRDAGSVDINTPDSPDTTVDTCAPSTCTALGANCGVIDDGCGALIDCGTCSDPDSCGGGGIDNQCGCTPRNCESIGADCGVIDDGCGGEIPCGSCSAPDTCGGGNTPNVCAHPLCRDGWCFENPYPHVDDLLRVVHGHGTTLALGVRGIAIARTTGGWMRWPAFTRVPSDLFDAVLDASDQGWVVGEHGTILRLDGAVLSCTRPDDEYWSPTKKDLRAIIDADGTLWAGGEDVILSFDGSDWITRHTFEGVVHAMAASDDGSLLAVGDRDGSALVLELGDAWIESPLESDCALRGIASLGNTFYAVGERVHESSPCILRRSDEQWTEIPIRGTSSGAALRAIVPDDGHLIAVGRGGAVVHVETDSAELLAPLFPNTDLNALASTAQGPILVGAQGLVAERRAGFWRPNIGRVPPSDSAPIVWARREHDVWAGGDGWVMRYDGLRWSAAAVPLRVSGMFGLSPNDIWVVGNRDAAGSPASYEGVVIRFDGSGWNEVLTREGESFTTISGTSTTDVRIEATSGCLRFDGETWTEHDSVSFPRAGESGGLADPGWSLDDHEFTRIDKSGNASSATSVWPFDGLQSNPADAWALSDSEVWAVGADGAVRRDADGWQKMLRGVEVHGVSGSGGDDVWLVGSGDSGGPVWHWDGQALESVAGPGEELNTVSVFGPGDVVCAGEQIHWRDQGGWHSESIPGSGPIRAIWAWGRDDVWAARGTSLLRFQGVEWEVIDPAAQLDRPPTSGSTEVEIHEIVGIAPDQVFFAGHSPNRDAAILLVFDQGEWGNGLLQSLAGEVTFSGLWAKDLENAWVTMGEVGWIYHYRHSIRMFDTVDATTARPLEAIAGHGDKRWVFGPHGAVLGTTVP